ncbi:leucine-rich repeat domain-containing protein [Acidovorax sp.]|uniref:leucine-rich repeat domain-containing protein n=1 Tax=Acidovorax sp. TaxID=1872122 RepID=UPI00391A10F4
MPASTTPLPHPMTAAKPKWTNRIYGPIRVLNHADGLHLEKFTDADLDQIAGCDDVLEIDLRSNRTARPVDLVRLVHITALRRLSLERVKFTNLQALRALPHLQSLQIAHCDFQDFEALNGLQIETLFLWNNKIKAFPPGLNLPRLDSLYLSHNRIADVEFVASYPTLTQLHINGNQVADLAPLTACTALTRLWVDDNPLTTLAPLAGRRFERLHVDNALSAERAALQLELPEPIYEQDAESAEAWRVAQLMEAQDWPQLYAITSPALLGRAFSNLVHGHANADMMRGALAHPAPGAFEAMVAKGLRPHYVSVREQLVEVLSAYGERLVPPLARAFEDLLAQGYVHDPAFYAGKFKQEHFTLARILQQVASPAFADLFLAFFAQRESFSQLHLELYKWLLDVVGKTQSPALVEPLIDLLRFEKHILGGDAAFMKKIFKAIGQLGSAADAALLAGRFDVSAELRPDVADAYHATVARLQKSKKKANAG